jgi:Di-haem oxidoreductase, putative peroxidase
VSDNCRRSVRHPEEGLAMRVTFSAARLGGMLLGLGLCITACEAYGDDQAKAGANPAKTNPVAVGYEIFNREWMPNDPRGHGGDGLGPVYNDSSCIACHNSGGSGGAGPVSKNIDILSASRNLGAMEPTQAVVAAPVQSGNVCKPVENAFATAQSSALNALDPIHPGFRTARNVVLHKFGIDPHSQDPSLRKPWHLHPHCRRSSYRPRLL